MSDAYLETHREHWDAMVDAHWESAFYDVPGWLAGRDSLTPIDDAVLPDDLEGKRLLHLQCHFGQDTLSLARRGAIVTGADLSSRAIERARELAAKANLRGTFVHSDVYHLPKHLEGTFDVVYTSWGTIGWLPNIARSAAVVDHFLAPGGSFVFAEFHPMVWMYGADRSKFEYSYFNRGPIIEEGAESYSGDAKAKTSEVGWTTRWATSSVRCSTAASSSSDFTSTTSHPTTASPTRSRSSRGSGNGVGSRASFR